MILRSWERGIITVNDLPHRVELVQRLHGGVKQPQPNQPPGSRRVDDAGCRAVRTSQVKLSLTMNRADWELLLCKIALLVCVAIIAFFLALSYLFWRT